MGADCAKTTGRARRRLLAPNIATWSLAGFSAGSAGRRPCGRRPRVKPTVSGRNGLEPREIVAWVDLHQGLAAGPVLGAWDTDFRYMRVANRPEAPAAPRNLNAAQRHEFTRLTDKTERTKK